MSTTTAAAQTPARSTSQTHFFLRKLHSLTGIVPIGGYLLFHIYENLKVALPNGPAAYDEVIENVAKVAPIPWFYLLEFGLILIPIAYHSFYGFYVWWQGSPNALSYPYRRGWLYWAQRISGIVAFLYIAYHYWALRWPTFIGTHPATYQVVREHLSNPAVWAFYAVGNVAAAFHFGNGLYGFAFSWGLAIGRRAQAAWEAIGWGLTLLLSAASLHILWVFVR